MTEGERLALRQLEAVASGGDALEIIRVLEPNEERSRLCVEVSLDCAGIAHRPQGVRVHERERLRIYVNSGFPWSPLSVYVNHLDWAGTPHVQWGNYLCLYASSTSEWRPEDGVFGLLDRLALWLGKAAVGELDPADAPLHPPVAYPSGAAPRLVIRADAPEVGEVPWIGMARLNRISEERVDVLGWTENLSGSEDLSPALLLPTPMDWEYPTTIQELLGVLAARGIPWDRLLALLRRGSLRRPKESGMPLIVGTPMRRGADGEVRQHLTAWYLPPVIADGIRASLAVYSDDAKLKEIGEKLEEIIAGWAEDASVAWCWIDEMRPEVTERRDSLSSIHRAFAGKTVAVWGCGAIGGHVAEWLARAEVSRVILYDNDEVSAGVLTRQPYTDVDIGKTKVAALGERLKAISTDLEVTPLFGNVLTGPLAREDWHDGADFVIDATAAPAVASKLEAMRRKVGNGDATALGMIFGHTAEHGICVVAPPGRSGGTADLLRQTMLDCTGRAGLGDFANEFWPDPPRVDVFQPEPGCSAPTFRGSGAEVAALAGTLLTSAAAAITKSPSQASGHLHVLPSAPHRGPRSVKLGWEPDTILQDGLDRYEVRISPKAHRSIRAWIARNGRLDDPSSETGGVLFGWRDPAAGVLWVDEASGPPPDSIASPEEFVCGTEGIKDRNEKIRKQTRRATSFVGMWHTHPGGPAIPSPRDVASMAELVSMEPLPEVLMVICGEEELGAYVFAREDLPKPFGVLEIEVRTEPTPEPSPPQRDVGLALSGGGSRAIAFHLGCLRALHDRGALERVRVLSGVSGGAIAAATYAYGQESFADLDARLEELLRRGLQREIMRRAALSPRALNSLAAWAVSGGAALGARATARVRGRSPSGSPIRRWATPADALEATLAKQLFGETTLEGPPRDGIDIILNACDLRTGSAVRFGSRESGIWRAHLGRFVDPIPVATAVAASAAYPLLLPSIDREFDFEGRDGERRRERVVLSDGGLFDNLGTSCLEPGRSKDHSYNVFDVDYIVACDAGRGLLDDAFPVSGLARLGRSFEATHRKVQDANRSRLHNLAADGRLAGFAMPYLGQQDVALPWIPPDLVRREQVASYPTNFAPMAQTEIDMLALRGEQLTHLLIERWCPDL
jgi:integrative and conjugative element protein (TIGR02256 family)